MENLSVSVLSSFKSGLKKLTGLKKRSYAWELCNAYFGGSSRKMERILGVCRHMVNLGHHEFSRGIRCIDNYSGRGRKKKEFDYPLLAADIEEIVSVDTQSDRCHNDTKGYLKTTCLRVRTALIGEKGYSEDSFCLSTVNAVLNRLNYTLKKVRKTLPLKRLDETDAIFENIKLHRTTKTPGVLQLSIDVKDKVKVGQLSRKGYHRGKEEVCALDKDQHWETSLVPLGILEIGSGKNSIIVGNSCETSDFIVDGLEKWYETTTTDLSQIHTLELYLDNGPAVNSSRTQFIKRIMEFACITNLKVHLLYYPPYHSKYNPIERVWAATEQYWNGTILHSVEKVILTLSNVKWKEINLKPIFIDKIYHKGVTIAKKEMCKFEAFLIRKKDLQKWDVCINPSFQMGSLFLE